ncbi:MAG: protease SohB, partial [Porticoccus sp.]
MEFLSQYGLFLAKAITMVVGLLVVIGTIAGLSSKIRKPARGELEVHRLNEDFEHMGNTLQ